MLGLGWRVIRGSFLRESAHTPGDEMEMAGRDWIEEEQKIFSDIQELGRRYEKPILLASDMVHLIPGYTEGIRSRRVAAYPSLQRAVRAYLGLVQRYKFLERVQGIPKSKVQKSKSKMTI